MELSDIEVIKLYELLSTFPGLDPCLYALLERLLTCIRPAQDAPRSASIQGASRQLAPASTSRSGSSKSLLLGNIRMH